MSEQHPVKVKTYNSVYLDEAKRHLRIEADWEQDDEYITNLISAATQLCENYIGKDIALTTNTLKLWDYAGQYLTIDEGNFISVDSIETDTSVS